MGYFLKRSSTVVRPSIELVTHRANRTYAKSKKITDVLSADCWRGKRCFILGGGESLLNFDLHRLDNELTIGINRSFERYDSTILYGMDTSFYQNLTNHIIDKYDRTADSHQKWQKFRGIKVFLCPLNDFSFDDSVYVIRRVGDEIVSKDLSVGIYGGNNSGFGAIMLAIALGANPVYLLGYDMQCNGRTHWHSGYPKQAKLDFERKLTSYRVLIGKFAPKIDAAGVKVINCTSGSALKCFVTANIDEVLK